MYARLLQKNIEKWMFQGKIITVYGARQVGKTTLIHSLLKQYQEKETLFLNADEENVRNILRPTSATELKNIIGNPDILVIDEAQRITDIGLILKIIHDAFPHIQILVTGSSTLSLANKISEPLTGRNIKFQLFPLSLSEVSKNAFEATANINHILLWGSYPDIFSRDISYKKTLLENIVNQYLYQDVLEYGNIKKPHIIKKLLQLLAFQIGSEVSLSEFSQNLEVDKKTVEKYLDLLEKSFVVFSLSSLSRNLRKEISKSKKYYFYDLGIRNALIENFLDIDIRQDRGGMFENFFIIERIKRNQYSNISVKSYFWRTYAQKEIDYIEEKDGKIFAFETKWKIQKKISVPKDFRAAYPNSTFTPVEKKNAHEFLLS